MVSNKFLAALSVKLGFHKHLRFNGAAVEFQNREYVGEIEEAEREGKGARDYWTNTKQPPKVDSSQLMHHCRANNTIPGTFRHRRSLHRCPIRRLRIQLPRGRTLLRRAHPLVLRRHVHLRHLREQPPYGESPALLCNPLIQLINPLRPTSTTS